MPTPRSNGPTSSQWLLIALAAIVFFLIARWALDLIAGLITFVIAAILMWWFISYLRRKYEGPDHRR